MRNKIIFIFLDGIGLGKHVATNPFVKASMPKLHSIIGEKLLENISINQHEILVKGIDSCLNVKGIPQSATGQACLFTGFRAQEILGYHLPAYPNDELVNLIKTRSIFKYAKENQISSIFANSYTNRFFDNFMQDMSSYSVTTHCVLAANGHFNTIDDLINNNAVHWDITNSTLQGTPNNQVPEITPFNAGKNLANIANNFELVLYECFLPDLIGHKKNMDTSIWFLEMFDEFLRGLTSMVTPNVNILISSDHGNIEDLSTGGHTTNQVPLIVLGNHAKRFSNVHSIDQIFNAIFSNIFDIN